MIAYVIWFLYLFSLCESHSVVAEYKHLDKKVMEILFRVRLEEEWDEMLKTVEYYIMKLMNYGLRIAQEMETDRKVANKIVNNGKPKFMNVTLNEQNLIENAGIPQNKIEEFYNLRTELHRTWVEFVKIVKAMKWVKKTRKPYIMQGAFHGRRLGKRKGAKNPYIPQESKKVELDSEELDRKSSLYSSMTESEYD